MCWLIWACHLELSVSRKICPSEHITILPDGLTRLLIKKSKLNEPASTPSIQSFPSGLIIMPKVLSGNWLFLTSENHHSLRVLTLSGETLLLPELGIYSTNSRYGNTDPQIRIKRITHSTLLVQRQNTIHTNCWVRRATSWEWSQKSVGSPCLWGLSHFFPPKFSAAKKYHCHTLQPFLIF